MKTFRDKVCISKPLETNSVHPKGPLDGFAILIPSNGHIPLKITHPSLKTNGSGLIDNRTLTHSEASWQGYFYVKTRYLTKT